MTFITRIKTSLLYDLHKYTYLSPSMHGQWVIDMLWDPPPKKKTQKKTWSGPADNCMVIMVTILIHNKTTNDAVLHVFPQLIRCSLWDAITKHYSWPDLDKVVTLSSYILRLLVCQPIGVQIEKKKPTLKYKCHKQTC